jgi:hypothetical protein
VPPAVRQGLFLFSIIWLLVGIAALAEHLGLETGVGMSAIIYPAIPLYALSSGFGHTTPTHGFLWDSAHGPPFLTLLGVALVYVVPSLLGWRLFRYRAPHR